MVFFNCNACGQSIKKNMVEKHYNTVCPQCECLSCLDCGKEFWGDEYSKHFQCITEEEKYSGKDYKPKPNANKGEAKQEKWIQQIRDVIKTTQGDSDLKNLLEQLISFNNIPRKKAKFLNFLRNSVRIRKEETALKAWEIFSASQKPIESNNKIADKQDQSSNLKSCDEINGHSNKKRKLCDTKENDSSEVDNSVNKKIKVMNTNSKDESDDNSDHETSASEKSESKKKFKYIKLVKMILKNEDDRKLSFKRLKKKVMAEYSSQETTNQKSVEEMWASIEKKLKSNKKFKVHKEKVILL